MPDEKKWNHYLMEMFGSGERIDPIAPSDVIYVPSEQAIDMALQSMSADKA